MINEIFVRPTNKGNIYFFYPYANVIYVHDRIQLYYYSMIKYIKIIKVQISIFTFQVGTLFCF
jgi:hypothetical protein